MKSLREFAASLRKTSLRLNSAAFIQVRRRAVYNPRSFLPPIRGNRKRSTSGHTVAAK